MTKTKNILLWRITLGFVLSTLIGSVKCECHSHLKNSWVGGITADGTLLTNQSFCDGGTVLDSKNATLYLESDIFYSHIIQVQNLQDINNVVNRTLFQIWKRFHTIILDCPVQTRNLNVPTSNLHVPTSESIVDFNRAQKIRGLEPMKIWLRLNMLDDIKNDHSFCTYIAKATNNIFPGTFVGVLGNTEELFTVTGVQEAKIFPDRDFSWYSKKIKRFSYLGLQFGLMLNPSYCLLIPYTKMTPKQLDIFDEIYYYQEVQNALITDVLGQQTLRVPKAYQDCKTFLAQRPKGKPVNFVLIKSAIIIGLDPCVQNDHICLLNEDA